MSVKFALENSSRQHAPKIQLSRLDESKLRRNARYEYEASRGLSKPPETEAVSRMNSKSAGNNAKITWRLSYQCKIASLIISRENTCLSSDEHKYSACELFATVCVDIFLKKVTREGIRRRTTHRIANFAIFALNLSIQNEMKICEVPWNQKILLQTHSTRNIRMSRCKKKGKSFFSQPSIDTSNMATAEEIIIKYGTEIFLGSLSLFPPLL